MARFGIIGLIVVGATVTGAIFQPIEARTGRHDSMAGGVPSLDVKGSCADAQKFSTGDDKNTAYKGCMQDESNAKAELARRWSTFKVKDRSNCVEQARFPSPSYVEVLTCLEMDSDAMTMPRADGKTSPQIGGPVAPGLGASAPDQAPH
jgi:hypothetical protein